MGFWGRLRRFGEDVATGPVLADVRRRLENEQKARTYLTSNQFTEDLEQLQSGIEYLDGALQKAEYASYFSEYFSEYTEDIEAAREGLGKVYETISKPLDYYSTFEELRTFAAAVRAITHITPGQNPVAEGEAYGIAMQSLGRLAKKLPPPANAVGAIIEGMGKIFRNVVANMQPEVHMREPGIREVIDGL